MRFRVLAPGNATISIASASVLANDGKGTNVLTSSRGTDITILPASAVVPTPTPERIPAPTPAPVKKPVTPDAPTVATTTDVIVVPVVALEPVPVAVETKPANPWTDFINYLFGDAVFYGSFIYALGAFSIFFLLVFIAGLLLSLISGYFRREYGYGDEIRTLSYGSVEDEVKWHAAKIKKVKGRRKLNQAEQKIVNRFVAALKQAQETVDN